LDESIAIPRALLKDLYMGLAKVEEVLATLEELMDEEGLERIHKAEEEYKKGNYTLIQSGDEARKLASE